MSEFFGCRKVYGFESNVHQTLNLMKAKILTEASDIAWNQQGRPWLKQACLLQNSDSGSSRSLRFALKDPFEGRSGNVVFSRQRRDVNVAFSGHL